MRAGGNFGKVLRVAQEDIAVHEYRGYLPRLHGNRSFWGALVGREMGNGSMDVAYRRICRNGVWLLPLFQDSAAPRREAGRKEER